MVVKPLDEHSDDRFSRHKKTTKNNTYTDEKIIICIIRFESYYPVHNEYTRTHTHTYK